MPDPPACFADLNLDQIVDAVAAGRDEYGLKEFFYSPLSSADTIRYRHEGFRDFENAGLLGHVTSFAEKMRSMRDQLARFAKLHYANQRNAFFLDAVAFYGDAIGAFSADLSAAPLTSRGLRAFRQYLTDYAASPRFLALVEELNVIKAGLANVRYCILIKGDKVTVRDYEGEIDYSARQARRRWTWARNRRPRN